MKNLLANIPLINQMDIAGSAARGDLKFAMIATRDIAARVAEHLVRRGFRGKTAENFAGIFATAFEVAALKKAAWKAPSCRKFPDTCYA
jgi:hypothetical protein